MGYVPLSLSDLTVAALLVLANGALSVALTLRFEWKLAIAVARMVVQLLLAALVLRFVFAQTGIAWSLAVLAVMAAAAIAEGALRPERRFATLLLRIASGSVAFAAGLLATLVALALVQPATWYAPRYLVPLFGLISGTAIAAGSLVIDAMTYAAARERDEIETRLALGATRFAAFESILRRAIAVGLLPLIVILSTAGIINVPGMLAGQVLAGVDPVEAAKYQILLMLLIAGASATAAVAAGFVSIYLLTDDRDRLRLDRLTPKRSSQAKKPLLPAWLARQLRSMHRP